MKMMKLLGVLVVPFLLAGCAFYSPYSRPALLGGDADLGLIQNRTSKSVAKVQEAPNATNSGSSIAEPTGGGTVDIAPGSLSNLVKAASVITPLIPMLGTEQPRTYMVKASPAFYTVKSGDNLWTISRKNGTTVAALKKANGLRTSTLHVGQTLRLPIR